MTKKRQFRDDFWIKRLRTLYPYGLNEKAFEKICNSKEIDIAIGLFPPLQRKRARHQSRNNLRITLLTFFGKIDNWFH